MSWERFASSLGVMLKRVGLPGAIRCSPEGVALLLEWMAGSSCCCCCCWVRAVQSSAWCFVALRPDVGLGTDTGLRADGRAVFGRAARSQIPSRGPWRSPLGGRTGVGHSDLRSEGEAELSDDELSGREWKATRGRSGAGERRNRCCGLEVGGDLLALHRSCGEGLLL